MSKPTAFGEEVIAAGARALALRWGKGGAPTNPRWKSFGARSPEAYADQTWPVFADDARACLTATCAKLRELSEGGSGKATPKDG